MHCGTNPTTRPRAGASNPLQDALPMDMDVWYHLSTACERLFELMFFWVPVLGKQVGWAPWWWNLESLCGKTGGIDSCHDSPEQND